MIKKANPSVDPNAYQKSLDYLYGLEKFGMIFGLTHVERILQAIEDPHREIQAIHIGGTNGKGSTAAMMASILQKEGYRVGLYFPSSHPIHRTDQGEREGNWESRGGGIDRMDGGEDQGGEHYLSFHLF